MRTHALKHTHTPPVYRIPSVYNSEIVPARFKNVINDWQNKYIEALVKESSVVRVASCPVHSPARWAYTRLCMWVEMTSQYTVWRLFPPRAEQTVGKPRFRFYGVKQPQM